MWTTQLNQGASANANANANATGIIAQGKLPTHLLDNMAAQTQTDALPLGFGAVEGDEEVVGVGDTLAAVNNANFIALFITLLTLAKNHLDSAGWAACFNRIFN